MCCGSTVFDMFPVAKLQPFLFRARKYSYDVLNGGIRYTYL